MSSRLRRTARDTVAIVGRGWYRIESGQTVGIGDEVAAAVAGTRLYLPDDALPPPSASVVSPAVEVTNESSLSAARRLGGDVACLVFASARKPGGGFLTGAQAQEESIARASALHACLCAVGDFYAYHRHPPELTYSDRMIYCPAVPVFRDDTGALLPVPYRVSFLTAAAPNRSAIARTQPENLPDISTILRRRATRILDVAAAHGHRRLVLGAWGCGVFGNDPVTVTEAFAAALHRRPSFDRIVFAVLDTHPATPTYATFVDAFR